MLSSACYGNRSINDRALFAIVCSWNLCMG